MRVIHIENSYKTWNTSIMYIELIEECLLTYGSIRADIELNRSYLGMYIEWYLHNIGYWLTLPLVRLKKIKALNERFKHLDLESLEYKKHKCIYR